ncbi:MAG: DUF4537 domain-containing protein [Candidatus Lernaella stagnicola]|nr:DUF4537 domain-containing protein [Candidatus Lernaella stagnicola]
MSRKLCLFLIVALFIAATVALAGGKFVVGHAVYAEWTANGWYHGKIAKKCDAGWHIAFDDGDQKCCAPSQIVIDVVPPKAMVKVGVKVLAKWSDGRYYPGTVSAINGNKYSIAFNDGDQGTVSRNQLRLR